MPKEMGLCMQTIFPELILRLHSRSELFCRAALIKPARRPNLPFMRLEIMAMPLSIPFSQGIHE